MADGAEPVNFADPAFMANPYPALNAQREACPIAKDAMSSAWVVTRYDDVYAILHDRSLASDPSKGSPGSLASMLDETLGPDDRAILFMDDPEHARLRKLVVKAFTPRAIEELRPRTRDIARSLLDEVQDKTAFDFMTDFAQPLPTMVIAELIGVDSQDHRAFKAWADDAVKLLDPFAPPEVQQAAIRAREALGDYFEKAIASRQESPRDDLVSRLIAAREGSDALTATEMVAVLRLLLNAGNLTTTDLIGNGLLALLQHPEQEAMLREDPGRIPNAVEEMLRYDPPVIDILRTAPADMEIAGCPVATGESIQAEMAAANHDPRHFAEPERFDVGREEIDHLSFGGGTHYCLGASLARMEAIVAFEVLLERTESVQLAPGTTLEYRTNPSFRGLRSLPVEVRWR